MNSHHATKNNPTSEMVTQCIVFVTYNSMLTVVGKVAECNVHTQRKDYRHEKKRQKEAHPHCRRAGRSFSKNSDVSLSAEMEAATRSTRRGNLMAEYSKYSHPRAHLKFEDRERLGKAWNNWLRTKPGSISILAFAKAYGVSRTHWRRELQRCTSGAILTLDIRRRGKHERSLDCRRFCQMVGGCFS